MRHLENACVLQCVVPKLITRKIPEINRGLVLSKRLYLFSFIGEFFYERTYLLDYEQPPFFLYLFLIVRRDGSEKSRPRESRPRWRPPVFAPPTICRRANFFHLKIIKCIHLTVWFCELRSIFPSPVVARKNTSKKQNVRMY